VYVNRTGQFTFSAPADWRVHSCEDRDGAYVVAEHGSLSPVCGRGEYYQAWLLAESLTGDQRQVLPPNGSSYSYTAKITGTESVVADGVPGYRFTAHVDVTLPLPPPKGTDQVVYVFFNGVRTYAFWYDHWPTDPDRTPDFDRLVQQTLHFSA
jgi:hypothetical protein